MLQLTSMKERLCWNLQKDQWTIVSIGGSAYVKFAEVNNIPADAVIKLMTRWEKNDPKYAEAQKRLDKICEDRGFTAPNGKRYELLTRGASDIRQGDSLWVAEEYHDTIESFMYLGRQDRLREALAQSKFEVYGTLALSTSKTYEEQYGPFAECMKPWNIRNAVVLPDVEAETLPCRMDSIGTDDVLHLDEVRTVVDKKSDGLIYHIVNGSKHIRDHSVRMNLIKGLKHHIERNSWIRTLQELGAWTVTDVWGKTHDLRHVELVIFASAFKGYKAFDSWNDYINCCKKFKSAEMRVCVDCRHAVANFPTQQVRGLHMLPAFIDKAVDFNVATMEQYMAKEGAPALVGGIAGKIAEAYPAFLNTALMKNTLQGAWGTRMSDLLSGCFLNISTYQFIISDVLPMICKIVGVKERRLLKAGTIRTDMAPAGTKTIMTRAPMPGINYGLVENVDVPEKYRGLYIGGSVAINWDDPLMILFQCDFDGDKGCMTFVGDDFTRILWDACVSAIQRYDYRPLYFENNTPKKKWTMEGVYESVRTTNPAPIGIFDDAITKLCGAWESFYHGDMMQFRCDAAYLEKEVTVCVDNAKNGGEPGATAAVIVAKIKDAKLKKDRCYAFKHTSVNKKGEFAAECSKGKYGVVQSDPIAQFSVACAMMLPETYSVDAPAWTKTDYKVFTFGETKKVIPDLCRFQDDNCIWQQVSKYVADNTRKDEDGYVCDREETLRDAEALFWKLCGNANANASHGEILNQLIMHCFTAFGTDVLVSKVEEAQRLCVEMFGREMLERCYANLSE